MDEIKFTYLSDPTVTEIKWQSVRLLLDEVLNSDGFKGSFDNKGGVRNPPLIKAFKRKWDLARIDNGFRAVIAVQNNRLVGFILFTKHRDLFVCREAYKREIFTTVSHNDDPILFDLGIVGRRYRGSGVWRGMMSFLCANEKWSLIYGLTSPFNAYVLDLLQSYGACFMPTGSGELVWRCCEGIEPFYNNTDIGWVCFEFRRSTLETSLLKKQSLVHNDISWIELRSVKTDLGERYAARFRGRGKGVGVGKHSFLLDRISGYALCTNSIHDIKDAVLSIPVFDYNDFRTDVLMEYDAISEKVQRSSYDKIHDLVEAVCEKKTGKVVNLVDICGGNSSLWKGDLPVNSIVHDARNGKCIDINNVTGELCSDVKSADLILMVNALARLYNYADRRGRDYTQQEKKAFLRNICQLPGDNEHQTLYLLESICGERIGYRSIKRLLGKLQLFRDGNDSENWAAFWWYALAEKYLFPVVAHHSQKEIIGDFMIDSISEVVASASHPNRKVLLYSLSRRGDLLYKVMFQEAQYFCRQLTFIKPGIVSEKECRAWLRECNEQIGSNRLVDQLRKYRTFHAIKGEDTTFAFIVTTISFPPQTMDSFVEALLARADVVYYLQTDGTLSFRSRFGNELEGDPIGGCASLLTATFEFLCECLRSRFPSDQRNVLSVSVGKYSSLANGFSTLSANYLINDDEANGGVISDIVRCLFGELDKDINNEWLYQVSYQAISSAIGSIMSRNGSHNIGSHVLSSLSHNIGTMPDDRVLYQYIQHRMDYIATATTEHPRWKQPTMFVAGMMKEFLRQKHLLDYISSSEGLRAYRFQGQTVDATQENAIRMHVRRIPDTGLIDWESQSLLTTTTVDNFVAYGSEESIDLSRDVVVAVPGGVVGQHAYYTIIENIIRNAAKHEWAEAMRVWKIAKSELKTTVCKEAGIDPEHIGEKEYHELFVARYPNCQPRNLDVYIDFKDNPELQKVECRIWNDRVVSVNDMAQLRSDVLNYWRSCGVVGVEKLRSPAKAFRDWYRLLRDHRVLVNSGQSAFPVYNLIEKQLKQKDGSDRQDDDFVCGAIVDGLLAKNEHNEFVIADDAICAFIGASTAEEDRELANILTRKIQQSFIDGAGVLKKENWGIAEMRISAGLLRCQDIALIGGLPGAGDPTDIIYPVLVENLKGDNCVGYRFDFDKPKLLLVVLRSDVDEDHKRVIDESAKLHAERFGVTIITAEELDVGEHYPYSYVLFEHLDSTILKKLKNRQFALPFRNLYSASDIQDSVLGDFVPQYTGTFFENIDENIALLKSTSSAAKICHCLLESVYADWLKHVRIRGFHETNGCSSICLDLDGSSSFGNSSQTLISKEELLRFVFENSFNSAIRSFLKENGPEAGTGSVEERIRPGDGHRVVVSLPNQVAALLYAIASAPQRKIAKREELASAINVDEEQLINNAPDIVRAQLLLWISDVLGTNDFVSIDYDELDIDEKWLVAFGYEKELFVGNVESLARDKKCSYWLKRFVNYIATVILDQADSFLRKYEERFATLPKDFKETSDLGQQEWEWKVAGQLIEKVFTTSDADVRQAARESGAICYFRHGDEKQVRIDNRYYEPLSGAQSMFNAFASFKRDLGILNSQGLEVSTTDEARCRVTGFITRMVENAASRMLIVDERVMKFMREHDEVNNVIPGLGIAVADDNDPGVMKMFSSSYEREMPVFSGVKLTDFEIVIIHQGVIDKLLQGHEDKECVSAWLDNLIRKLHYVVITTGRGSPANIPDTARVLPYSVIESSILQRYPEKMILVDAVMNILPIRTIKGGHS